MVVMNNKLHNRLEGAMTIAWLAMDCFWMNELLGFAQAAAIVALLCALAIYFMLWNLGDVKAEMAHFITMLWLIMNTSWMMGDVDARYLEFARIFMWMSVIATVVFMLFSKDVLDRFRRSKW